MWKVYNWNLSTCISENSKYLQNTVNTSVTNCDEIIIAVDSVLAKKTNNITTNHWSLLLITIIVQNKRYNIYWKIMNLKKFVLKSYVLSFQKIIKLEDFDFNNILLVEKSHENILINDIS